MTTLTELRESIYADYRARTPKSYALFERAKQILPGGVSGNLRFFSPYPVYMASASGAQMTDLDGNSYIDCFGCNGPNLLGHRHPSVEAAIDAVKAYGNMPLNPDLLVDCAEQIKSVIPSAQRVRFLNSGTEGVMSAVRYARGFTGKEKVLKFYGHYHGQDDQFLLGVDPQGSVFGDGIPQDAIKNTLSARFNDEQHFLAQIRRHDDIAAVILCPAMHAGGLWGAKKEFLQVVREETAARNIVLIFDEVITGFRMGPGGAQALHGVTPDLTVLAKALAAGEKLAAVAGREDIMRVTDPLAPAGTPRVFQSGTGNDGVRALAAASAAIEEYKRLDVAGAYQQLSEQVERFSIFIQGCFAEHGIPLHVNYLASMAQLFISDADASFEGYSDLSTELLEHFYLALINQGVMLSLPTSNHIYFSFAHDKAAFDTIENAIAQVFDCYPFKQAYLSEQSRS